MSTRLCVGNLPYDATTNSIREVFLKCGHVADVELAPEKESGRSRGMAFVTMGTEALAMLAIEALDGLVHEGRPLRVSRAVGEKRATATDARKEETRAASIRQQFHERGNMTYELQCGGEPLTIRVFREDESGCRIEATRNDAADAIRVSASAATAAAALQQVAESWIARSAMVSLPRYDWEAIGRALAAVRAV